MIGGREQTAGQLVGERPAVRVSAGFVAAVVVVVATLVRLPTLAMPLIETHAFRQTQTAFPAVIYAREGIDLLRPQVPVFGPPYVLPFEFPIVQAVGALLIRAGLSPEVAMRSLALAGFLGTAVLLWALLRRHVNERTALIALVVFVASPFGLLFGRAALIEFPTTFACLLFVYAILEWHTTGQRRWLPIALVAGSLAALVKLTTAVFWLAPVLLTRRWLALPLLAIPAVLGLAWTRYADGIRAANPYGGFLESANLAPWMFGGDRLDPALWLPIAGTVIATAGLLLAPFALLCLFRSERMLWAWMGIALVGPILLMTNLYSIHDYYAAAIVPALAALIGGGLDRALERVPRLAVPAVVVAVGVVVISATYWLPAYRGADDRGVMARAAEIRAATEPSDFVVIVERDWSPAPFFYADRRGVVIQEGLGLPIPEGVRVR